MSDSAGNTTTDTTSWVVDRQAPVLTLTGPSTGTTGQSLAYTVAHSNLDAGQEIALWTQTLGQVATTNAANGSDATINVTFFSQSSQNLWVVASDKVGNTTSTEDATITTM